MKNKTNRIHVLILMMAISFLLIFQNGCGFLNKKEKEWKPVTYQNATFVHTVKWKNETLKIIAKWYTKDISSWKAIANANPVINPNFLYIDNIIYIPKKLLKTKNPMPKTFITKNDKLNRTKTAENQSIQKNVPRHKALKYKKPKNKPAPIPTPPVPQGPKDDTQDEEDDIELFGPK